MQDQSAPAAACGAARPVAEADPSASGASGASGAPPPWAQQPGEPAAAFALFTRYLHLGKDRSLAALITALPAADRPSWSGNAIRKTSANWRWYKRAVAWDHAQPSVPWETAERQLWHQQPDEPDAVYALFREYLALGPQRKLVTVTDHYRHQGITWLTDAYVKRMARDWRWRDRAAASDAAQSATSPQLAPQLWEQQPYERNEWYKRFLHFLHLGPERTVFHVYSDLVANDPLTPTPTAFYWEARHRNWQERAAAWDRCQEAAAASLDPSAPSTPLTNQDPADLPPWDRQPGENVRYFGLLCHYLELGPTRSISQTARDMATGQHTASHASAGYLFSIARRWHWQARAAAWDAHQRDLLALRTLERRAALHEHRLDVAEAAFDHALDAFNTAELAGLSRDQARKLLPTIFNILKESGAIQRTEFDYADKHLKPTDGSAPASADSLAAAHAAQAAGSAPLPAPPPAFITVPASFAGLPLLVGVGPDPDLKRDLFPLEATPGLHVHRLTDLTRDELEDTLRREQQHGRPIQLVHLAVHADRTSLQFADGPVDGPWLGEQLAGIQVLVLGGCATSAVGDWLRGIPYVVTFSGPVSHPNAAVFAEHFWKAIGKGKDPTDALGRARAKCVPSVRPLITQHW